MPTPTDSERLDWLTENPEKIQAVRGTRWFRWRVMSKRGTWSLTIFDTPREAIDAGILDRGGQ